MINLTRLWTGQTQPADDLRYGTSSRSVSTSADLLGEIRYVASARDEFRRAIRSGPCGSCRWFDIGGGGFRTRAAFANGGDLWGSDPACYLENEERLEALVA